MIRRAAPLLVLLLAGTGLAQPSGPDGNLPLPAADVQRRLEREPFTIAAVGDTEGGIMDTARLTLDFGQPPRLAAKWKAAPGYDESWNNSPRREIGAYVVQQLLFAPEDYVVPPVALRCIPFAIFRPLDDDPESNVPPHPCVLGTLSAWLQNVTRPDNILQRERFSRDPRYAYHFANFNLLAFLIQHRDRKDSNFLMSTDPGNPQVFSIDNGIAFSGWYNFLTWHFDALAVADLPRRSIARLRRVTPADLAALGVLAELQPDAHGVLRAVPPGPNADPQRGVRRVGDGIQIGLTAEEIAGVAARREEILARIARGEADVF